MNDLILRKLCAQNLPEYAFIKPPEIKKRVWRWKGKCALRPLTRYKTIGTIEMPKFEFTKALENFVFNTVFTRSEAIAASCSAQYECLEARERFLLHFPVSKAVKIEEFEQTQTQTIQQSSSYLKVSIFLQKGAVMALCSDQLDRKSATSNSHAFA